VIVLDTNVVSELMRPAPAAVVVAWLGRHEVGTLMTTAVTVAEIRFGLARLPAGGRATQLQRLADEVFGRFASQVLPFDVDAATLYGELAAERERTGRPIDALDAQIASICRLRGAPLATRNTRDFLDTGVELIDPWTA
jgi:toxin FitB